MNEGIRTAARQIAAARSAVAVYDAAVAGVDRMLDADRCEFLVESNGQLVVTADSTDRTPGPGRTYPLLTGIPGGAYTTDRTCIIDDTQDVRRATAVQADRSTTTPDFRSLCCVPIAGHGLLLAKAIAPSAFGEDDLERIKLLASVAEGALEYIESGPAALSDGGDRRNPDRADLLDQVADILSHDLKSPLMVARGSLKLASETGDDEQFDRVTRALDRVEKLVDEVVILARTGVIIDDTTVVELEEIGRTAWDNVGSAEATLTIESSARFVASEQAVIHLFENLLENAITHAGPAVAVRTGPTADGFYVEDDGPGIRTEARERVFDRGYSLTDDTTGLGLNIVQRIVDDHDWWIRVEPSADGGARFVVGGVELIDD